MDRLSDFDRSSSFDSAAVLGDRQLHLYVERGRRLQREAVRGVFSNAGRQLWRAVSGWGELRFSHPRSRVGC